MPDVFTKKKRSEVMSRIRSRGNRATELALAKVLRGMGVTGWRRHVSIVIRQQVKTPSGKLVVKKATKVSAYRLSVRPDFVFRVRRMALFVDGCFWHACPIHATQPAGNAAFWAEKLLRNQTRDRLVTRLLRANGWKVVRIWEHELTVRQRSKLVRKLNRMLAL